MRHLRSMLRPRLDSSLPGWTTVVLLLVSSAVAAYQSKEAGGLLAEAEVRRARADAARTKLEQEVTRLSPEQARHWQALGAEIAYPWSDFLQAVERTSSVDIELLEMTPDKSRRQMILRGEARNIGTLVAYVQALAAQPGLRDVLVSSMQNIERGSLLTVEFEIRMSVT